MSAMMALMTTLTLLSLLVTGIYCQADNLGTEFLITFMRNEVENPLNVPLELFITTPRTIPVQVEVTTPKFTEAPIRIRTTVVSGQVEKIELSYLLRQHFVGIEQKVIYVHADNDIAVYALNKERYSTDGFLVYPTDVIGYEYYTISHTPTNSYTMFAIASKYDDTQISIAFPDGQGRSIPLRVIYNGQTYTNNDRINITLQAYESFLCLAEDQSDLTGSHITSSLPVAVFSGNVRSWVGAWSSRDHLAVQLPPVQAYGTTYPIVPTPGRTIGDVVRVISSKPSSRVMVEGLSTRYFDLGDLSSYVDFNILSNTTTTVTSDDPILVVLITQSQHADTELADPTMSIVTAVNQYMSDYVFSTPQYHEGGSYDNWLALIAHFKEITGLTFDNRPFSEFNPQWTPLPGTNYVGTQVRITAGAHAIRHISPVAVFGGYVYGTADKESYSFQIGTRMALINQPCIPTETVFGDGLDNDCDGKIDEEICTGTNINQDNDGDGNSDEDCAISRDISAGAPDSGGRQFLVFFMENTVDAPRFIPLEIHVTPLRSSVAYVQVESPKWFEPVIWQKKQVNFGSVETFYIPYTMKESGTGMTSKALFITSDQDVTVYVLNKEQYSADAFLALPIDVLGKQYYTVTHWPNSDSSQCQIGVVGVNDGTLVNITFPSQAGRGTIQVEFEGQSYTNGDTLSLVINRYSSLQIQSKGDLTGTLIKSTQKVAVLSGNIRTSVGSGSSRDHLVAMLPPLESWGKLYCTAPIPGRSVGDYFYVVAAENNTRVEVTGKLNFTLQAGQSRQLIISSMEHVAIRSDRPILVAQLSQSQQSMAEIGDPTMILLPSQEQWANAYTFSTTTQSQYSSSQVDYLNYLVLVAPASQIDGLLYDGKSIPNLFTTWYPVAGTNFSSTTFMIEEGVHTIQHIDPTVTFSVIVYGNADKESYGFPAGMRLARINAPCETTLVSPGDGIDNDCDGRIDEEMCDADGAAVDTDGDGRLNEDCAVYVPPVTQPTTVPFTSSTAVPATAVSTERPVWMIVGPPGPQGSVGMPGPPGPQGAPGYNGYPGNPGLDGENGVDGAKGEVGATGLSGQKGDIGLPGLTGVTGEQGATGMTGPQGVPGLPGVTGSKGEPGTSIQGGQGSTGLPGQTGATGMIGATGNTGVTGPKGDRGLIGFTGATGVGGEKGSKGDMGPAYQDVDECAAAASNPCSDECINTIGSFYCSCKEGFALDNTNRNCVDLDECALYNGGCIDRCFNTLGSFTCQCTKQGYTLANDLKSCIDIDECNLKTHNCTNMETCINSVGGFTCVSTSSIEPITTARPTPSCAVGKESNPLNVAECIDINECNVNNGGCIDLCENVEGSYFCKCSFGYQLGQDLRSCQDEDECAIDGRHGCKADEVCVNSVGSYHCLAQSGSSSLQIDKAPQSSLGSVDTSGLIDGNIVLGLLIWLVVISVLLVVLLVVVCKQGRDQETVKQNLINDMRDIYQSQSILPYSRLQARSDNIPGSVANSSVRSYA